MHVHIRCGIAVLAGGLALGMGAGIAAEAPISAAECFLPAFKAANADAVAACYAEDAILWFPGGPMAKGRTAIRDGFAGYFKHMAVKQATLSPIGDEMMGDTRVAWGTYAITLMNKDTKVESVENGRFTDVQKLIDGKWLYIVDHPSDDPAPTAE